MDFIKAKKIPLPKQPCPVDSRINLNFITAWQKTGDESGKFYFLISDISHAIGFTSTNNPSIVEAFGESRTERGAGGKNARFVHQSNVVGGLKSFVANSYTPLTTTIKYKRRQNAISFISWFEKLLETESPSVDEIIATIEERLVYARQLND